MKRAPDFTPEPDAKNALSLTLPLWAVWSIVVGFVSATVYFVTLLNTINGKLDSVSSDRWKRSHMREFAHRLQSAAPSIKVPDVDQVTKDLE